MEISPLFLATIQTSFFLGLLHGVNPCGHSWLVLAPFVANEHRGRRVFLLTVSFLSGTLLACMLIGFTIGAISRFIPPSSGVIVETITAILLVILGGILLYNPHLLHHHSHSQEETDTAPCCHSHHNHHTSSPVQRLKRISAASRFVAPALFLIGFCNMIIPCPTVAIMYSYALHSGKAIEGLLVFASYAVSTIIAVSCVILLIYSVTNMAGKLQKKWIEPCIMRISAMVILAFSGYELYKLYLA